MRFLSADITKAAQLVVDAALASSCIASALQSLRNVGEILEQLTCADRLEASALSIAA